jgi:transposase
LIPAGVQVFVALEPVDLRYGFERLSGWVREHIGYDARSGALFVFFGKRRSTVKIVFADSSGACLFWKKLDRGSFARPEAPEGGASHVELDEASFEALLDGLPIAPTAEFAHPSRQRVH